MNSNIAEMNRILNELVEMKRVAPLTIFLTAVAVYALTLILGMDCAESFKKIRYNLKNKRFVEVLKIDVVWWALCVTVLSFLIGVAVMMRCSEEIKETKRRIKLLQALKECVIYVDGQEVPIDKLGSDEGDIIEKYGINSFEVNYAKKEVYIIPSND